MHDKNICFYLIVKFMLIDSYTSIGSIINDFVIHAAVQCPVLGGLTNGNVDYTARTVGSIASYTCNASFTLVGPASRKCRQKGKWKGSKPSCVQG